MRQILEALQRYEAEHGHFPPACVTDDVGHPMHSWRVLILPYLEEHELYEQYNFEEAWDSPVNAVLWDKPPRVFRCASHGHHGEHRGEHTTNYVLITGKGSAFDGEHVSTLEDFADGTKTTLLVTEVNQESVPWTAPRDLDARDFAAAFGDPLPSYETNHSGDVIVVGFADGHAAAMYRGIDRDAVSALTTMSAGDEPLQPLLAEGR